MQRRKHTEVHTHTPLFNLLRASLIWSCRIWTQSLAPGSFSILFAVQYFSVKTTHTHAHVHIAQPKNISNVYHSFKVIFSSCFLPSDTHL